MPINIAQLNDAVTYTVADGALTNCKYESHRSELESFPPLLKLLLLATMKFSKTLVQC